MPTILDADDPRLDDYRHLTDASARRVVERVGARHGIFVAEGPVALDQLLRSGHRVRSVVLTPARAEALGEVAPPGCPTHVVPREVLAQVCGYDVHRGVLAAADRPAPQPADAVVTAAVADGRSLVLAEAVNDNENVGALFRNAAALGLGAVLLDPACADPFYRRSIRVSSGWSMRLPHARVAHAAAALELLGHAGIRRIALCPGDGAVPVDRAAHDGALDGPVALVLGAEGPGLSRATVAACDLSVRVPMADGVDSLNVATSLAVVAAFAAARRGWR